ALEVVQSVGVGVDQAVVVPSVHLAELIQNVVLLKDGDHLGVVAVVAHADGGQAAAEVVVAVADDAGDAVLVEHHRGLAGALIDGPQALVDGEQVVVLSVVGIVLVHVVLGPDEEVGHGGILVGGDAVELAVDIAGLQVLLGDQIGEAGNVGHQIGQVGESAHVHVGGIGAHVGEDDVVVIVGLDQHGAPVIPAAPIHHLQVHMGADLLL